MSERPKITVEELILELQKQDPKAPVLVEGCDCYGDAVGVTSFPDGDVVIERNP